MLQSWNLPRSSSSASALASRFAAFRRQPVSPNAATDVSVGLRTGSDKFSLPAMRADLVPAASGNSQTSTGNARQAGRERSSLARRRRRRSADTAWRPRSRPARPRPADRARHRRPRAWAIAHGPRPALARRPERTHALQVDALVEAIERRRPFGASPLVLDLSPERRARRQRRPIFTRWRLWVSACAATTAISNGELGRQRE